VIASSSIAGQVQSNQVDTHYIDLTFEDKAKLTVGGLRYTLTFPDNSKTSGTLGKQIKRTGVPQGDYTVELQGIMDAQWSVKEAALDTAVDLKVETTGVADGEKAVLEVYVRDGNYTDHLLEVIEKQVSGDKVQAQWTMRVDEKYLNICDVKSKQKKFSSPYFFYKVTIGELCERSGILRYKGKMDIELCDGNDKPVKNASYRIRLSTGEVRSGKLDQNGKIPVGDIPPTKHTVEFPDCQDVMGSGK